MLQLVLALSLLPGAVVDVEDLPTEAESVLILDLKDEAAKKGTAGLVAGLIASSVTNTLRLKVITQKDIEQALVLESDRQVAGCDTNACLSEIAGAYNAQLVLFGDIGELGGMTVLNINLFDSTTAQSRGRRSITADSAAELPAKIDQAMRELFKGVPMPGSSSSSSSSPPASSAAGQEEEWEPNALFVVGLTGLTAGVMGSMLTGFFALSKSDEGENGPTGGLLIATGVGLLVAAAGGAALGLSFME